MHAGRESLAAYSIFWWLGQSLQVERFWQASHKVADFIADPSIVVDRLLLVCFLGREFWRILKRDMGHAWGTNKDRTVFVSMTAHGHDNVKLDWPQLVNRCRLVPGDIDARFLHHPHGIRIESMRFDASRIGFVLVGLECPGPTLGDLAAARVSRTEKQKFCHWILGVPISGWEDKTDPQLGLDAAFKAISIDLYSRDGTVSLGSKGESLVRGLPEMVAQQ